MASRKPLPLPQRMLDQIPLKNTFACSSLKIFLLQSRPHVQAFPSTRQHGVFLPLVAAVGHNLDFSSHHLHDQLTTVSGKHPEAGSRVDTEP